MYAIRSYYVTESQDANVQETYRWYEEQKKILIAAGLVYEDFATQLDELFKKRLKDARDADLENATDWRSGIERAVAGLAETYKSEADVTEGAFNSVFDNMASAIVDRITSYNVCYTKLLRLCLPQIFQ